VDVSALEVDQVQQLVQELAGLTHERSPLLILVKARCLANEHNAGPFGSFSGDNPVSGPGEFFTFFTGLYLLVELS
jgi:hypothetical protein